MSVDPYKIVPRGGNRFDFDSEGVHGFIRKRVEFKMLQENHFNVGFGDLIDKYWVDDTAESNNGDVVKIFSTIVRVIEDFMAVHPKATLYFTGSTMQRTRIYSIILKRHYARFSKQFQISVLWTCGGAEVRMPFDPTREVLTGTFIVKKIKCYSR
ncbi:hypothetical protein [Chitinophaga sp.]|uniref:DUF6934 family protein n=1 Tax=Chitinophaga sp. TaxID=1869181 RepID=UPI00263416CB|nr:hypothetical protein [uncultured Chitinophaga sp.]